MVMGITTTLIGVLPSYGQIGNWAPLLLLLLRLIQGFGAGAEFAGAAMLAVEFSPPQRRGFHGSWSQIGVAIGLAFAVGTFWLARHLPESDFMSWEWRIPFLASSVVLIVGLWLRVEIARSVREKVDELRGIVFDRLLDLEPEVALAAVGALEIAPDFVPEQRQLGGKPPAAGLSSGLAWLMNTTRRSGVGGGWGT